MHEAEELPPRECGGRFILSLAWAFVMFRRSAAPHPQGVTGSCSQLWSHRGLATVQPVSRSFFLWGQVPEGSATPPALAKRCHWQIERTDPAQPCQFC